LAIVTLFVCSTAWGQQAAQANWKDRAEYDLYESITKATDPAKRIELLTTWQQKYPDSDFKSTRQLLLVEAYQATNQIEKALQVGGEAMAADPKNFRLLWLIVTSVLRLQTPTPELLAVADKAAKILISDFDSLRPAGVSEADWEKSRNDVVAMGHMTLGWTAMQRKENPAAEKAFKESLKLSPNSAQVSYWLGTVLLLQQTTDKVSEGLFHLARAVSYTGEGALTPEARKNLEAYLIKTYNRFHGSHDGLDELRNLAASQAFPPEDFRIKSSAEIAAEMEEEFKKSNPMLALWMSVKKELAGDNGAQYFESSVKEAKLPGGVQGINKFRGKVIKCSPARNPKQIVVGIAEADQPEVTLALTEPMTGACPVGAEIAFEGLATAFSPDPFNLTLEVEKGDISGWPAPAKKAAPRKK